LSRAVNSSAAVKNQRGKGAGFAGTAAHDAKLGGAATGHCVMTKWLRK
jgi:hypothetical protein